jgi:hypothetical protein
MTEMLKRRYSITMSGAVGTYIPDLKTPSPKTWTACYFNVSLFINVRSRPRYTDETAASQLSIPNENCWVRCARGTIVWPPIPWSIHAVTWLKLIWNYMHARMSSSSLAQFLGVGNPCMQESEFANTMTMLPPRYDPARLNSCKSSVRVIKPHQDSRIYSPSLQILPLEAVSMSVRVAPLSPNDSESEMHVSTCRVRLDCVSAPSAFPHPTFTHSPGRLFHSSHQGSDKHDTNLTMAQPAALADECERLHIQSLQ